MESVDNDRDVGKSLVETADYLRCSKNDFVPQEIDAQRMILFLKYNRVDAGESFFFVTM